MVKQQEKKVIVKSDKLTQGEKKKIKNENKAKANPEKAAAKKEKNDATRARRYVSDSANMRSNSLQLPHFSFESFAHALICLSVTF